MAMRSVAQKIAVGGTALSRRADAARVTLVCLAVLVDDQLLIQAKTCLFKGTDVAGPAADGSWNNRIKVDEPYPVVSGPDEPHGGSVAALSLGQE